VLKLPDGAFSKAVQKVETPEALAAACQRLFPRSELLLAQSFVPTPFDWRIGVLDGQPLFACRYHMAPGHWQVIEWESGGRKVDEGEVDSVPVADAPPAVVDAAVRASRLIGDGLYGVDCKEVDGAAVVIEVNDNPNVDADCEDRVLGAELYRRIVGSLRARIERTRNVRPQA
jgi:glutathione synthase/RimK-type ligase-like ATP-grasp enzyme